MMCHQWALMLHCLLPLILRVWKLLHRGGLSNINGHLACFLLGQSSMPTILPNSTFLPVHSSISFQSWRVNSSSDGDPPGKEGEAFGALSGMLGRANFHDLYQLMNSSFLSTEVFLKKMFAQPYSLVILSCLNPSPYPPPCTKVVKEQTISYSSLSNFCLKRAKLFFFCTRYPCLSSIECYLQNSELKVFALHTLFPPSV